MTANIFATCFAVTKPEKPILKPLAPLLLRASEAVYHSHLTVNRLADKAWRHYSPFQQEGADSALADYYLEQWNKISGAKEEREPFCRLLTLTGVQRLYKALGTYGYQTVERGADTYVQYIPRAVNRLTELLKSLPELEALYNLMALIAPICQRRFIRN